MHSLIIILGDQLSHTITSLENSNKSKDLILMCELLEEATYVKHHKKKIAFIFSAMRHFAKHLQEKGHTVLYTKLDDQNNAKSLTGECKKILHSYKIDRIVITHPSEYRMLCNIKSWEEDLKIPVEIRPDNRFLCKIDEFKIWAKDKKQLRMEYFYRQMRKKHSILMEAQNPVGGKWNYDAENRKPPKENLRIPEPHINKPNNITNEVIDLVSRKFSTHFGDIEPFFFAVTRKEALVVLSKFINQRLENFGEFQDAMIQDEAWMYHSHISFYLNCGLLLPLECVKAVEQAYYKGNAPINSVEGFIRQIVGWREYVRGIYWLKMPQYAKENFFNAKRPLPSLYWTGNTKMNCMRQCVLETKKNSYAHHIQRLMVLGNFALIAGLDPIEVNEWFLIAYADAYEWVELPNVSGMILFADGGCLASKPYAAGGSYINKMSNYCKSCTYKVTKNKGTDACPFNYLYWNFIIKNRDKLISNHRTRIIYSLLDKMDSLKKKAIVSDSRIFLDNL